jgi:tRNA-Thr(GGU) m(6)t(6)A37 methyltransferase TsaA
MQFFPVDTWDANTPSIYIFNRGRYAFFTSTYREAGSFDNQAAPRLLGAYFEEHSMNDIPVRPIGVINSPFNDRANMPIQPCGACGVAGQAVIEESLVLGLKDLKGFSHIYLLYHFHMSQGFDLTVIPFMEPMERGLFSTRAPRRPNQIGLSIVRLDRIEGNVLHILDVDVLDGTPLLDIKPYFKTFDAFPEALSGWAEIHQNQADQVRSDTRFINPVDGHL